jgi:pyruvyltransferase
MKVFSVKTKNVGDTLAPILLESFTNKKAELVSSCDSGKLLVVGSFLEMVKENDIVLGIGSNKPNLFLDSPEGVRYLAVRGKLTRDHIYGAEVPEVYGDPALLLPLIYRPNIEKTRKVAIIPHYVDKPLFDGKEDYIDIEQDWQSVVRDILSCERIISSTLHGIVIAEAYGIPASWAVFSDKIEGGEFKYQDYFLGTDRKEQKPFTELPPIENLKEIQQRLVKAFLQL